MGTERSGGGRGDCPVVKSMYDGVTAAVKLRNGVSKCLMLKLAYTKGQCSVRCSLRLF